MPANLRLKINWKLTENYLKKFFKQISRYLGAAAILGVVYVVGVIMFQIWTIIVANKARKEIDQGIKIWMLD